MMRLFLCALSFVGTTATAEPQFIGNVVASWSGDGRTMILQEDFSFKDSNDHIWVAPAGATIDGASIPKAFWAIIGGPFSGRYRDASVVHDYQVDAQVGFWKDVHRAFYEGMIVSGVPETKAKLMYSAVYYFGKRWTVHRAPSLKCIQENKSCFGYLDVVSDQPKFNAEAFERLADFVENQTPTIEEIKNFDDPFFDKIREIDAKSYAQDWYFLPPKNDLNESPNSLFIDEL